MKKIFKNSVVLIFSSLLLLSISCEKLQEDYNQPTFKKSIKIGVVGDVSVLKEQVESMFFGAKLASEEINNSEGIHIQNESFHIELIYKNSGGSADQGIEAVNELIEEGVNIIVGPTFSSVAIEMAEKCIENNILMMSYSATTPELTFLEDRDLIWRTCPSDFTFGSVAAQYSFDSLETRKAAILYRDDRFGIGLSEIIRDTYTEMGGQVLSYVSFPGDLTNLTSYSFDYEINTLLKEQPDIIFTVTFSSEIAYLSNQIYNNPYFQAFDKKPYVFVNDGNLPEELIKNAIPGILEKTKGITSTNEGNDNYAKYKNNFATRFGFTPSTFSEHAYDAIYLIAYAIQMADSSAPLVFKNFLSSVSGTEDINGTPNVEPIIININEFNIGRNILLKGGLINYEGASGPINFDQSGDPKPKIVIWGIENNNYVELSYYE